MLEELMDLSTGLGVVLLPLLVLSVPAIILFVVLPAILLLALAAPLAVIAVPPYLVARRLRRRRTRWEGRAPHFTPRARSTTTAC
jgi:Flp pilus assembly protein TadB